jgi:alanyl-tRNA synthetase
VLGEHVQQAGSLVTKDSLRFDFSHFEAMTDDQIKTVENIVNDKISEFLPVTTKIMSIKEASSEGAIGLFDSKYGDVVRVVSIGDYSKELCGGIHVKNSGQIGALRILNENGIASGVRRIEAVTGPGIAAHDKMQSEILDAVCEKLKTKPDQLAVRIDSLVTEMQETKRELNELKNAQLASASDEIIKDAKEINGVRLITKSFEGLSIDELRTISDEVKADNKNIALVLAAVNDSKVTFLVSLTDDVVQKGYNAGKMIKEIAKAAGGGGGGKADMAQAGAKDPSKLDDAFKVAEELL